LEVVVLLKQVPATESDIRIADNGTSIRTEDIKWVINPYDEFAVEEALRIRETHEGTVTILSMGPERAIEAIRSAMAMGADRGVLINDSGEYEYDSLRTAQALAGVLKKIPFDVIIAGQRAVDDDNYQVGTAVAEFLNIPMIPMVTKEVIMEGNIQCHRSLEGGSVVLEAPLPVLFTTQRGLNEPRYASLPGIMKAKKKPLETKSPKDVGIDETVSGFHGTKILSMRLPPARNAGRIIEGETAEAKATELVRLLREEAKVI
jgi:electron transfer flavoprotein beta subunit